MSFDDDDALRPDCIERLLAHAREERLEVVYGRTLAHFQVVGGDPLSDIAVIRADREVPSPPEYGDASSLLFFF